MLKTVALLRDLHVPFIQLLKWSCHTKLSFRKDDSFNVPAELTVSPNADGTDDQVEKLHIIPFVNLLLILLKVR